MGKVEYLDCQCRMEVMRIENIKDEALNEFDTDLIQIAIYRQRCTSFKELLLMIWDILRTKSPYADDIILSNSDTDRLICILKSMLPVNQRLAERERSQSTCTTETDAKQRTETRS